MDINVNCSDCGKRLPSQGAHEVDIPCPVCGSNRKNILMEIIEDVGVSVHDSMRTKVKDPSLSSRKNPRVEVFAGSDLRKSDDRWMNKERVIDKDRDYYKETVSDPETGEVIHHTEEALSDHFGHGSAKCKKTDDV